MLLQFYFPFATTLKFLFDFSFLGDFLFRFNPHPLLLPAHFRLFLVRRIILKFKFVWIIAILLEMFTLKLRYHINLLIFLVIRSLFVSIAIHRNRCCVVAAVAVGVRTFWGKWKYQITFGWIEHYETKKNVEIFPRNGNSKKQWEQINLMDGWEESEME